MLLSQRNKGLMIMNGGSPWELRVVHPTAGPRPLSQHLKIPGLSPTDDSWEPPSCLSNLPDPVAEGSLGPLLCTSCVSLSCCKLRPFHLLKPSCRHQNPGLVEMGGFCFFISGGNERKWWCYGMFNEIIIDDISKTMSFQPPASIRSWWLESP